MEGLETATGLLRLPSEYTTYSFPNTSFSAAFPHLAQPMLTWLSLNPGSRDFFLPHRATRGLLVICVFLASYQLNYSINFSMPGPPNSVTVHLDHEELDGFEQIRLNLVPVIFITLGSLNVDFATTI